MDNIELAFGLFRGAASLVAFVYTVHLMAREA